MRSPLFALAILGLIAGCGASQEPPTAPGGPGAGRQALSFTAPCESVSCGGVPDSLGSENAVRCAEVKAACSWAPGGDQTVSYRQCRPEECAPTAAPNAQVCPAGTTFGGSVCGAENDGPCRWTTACTPPRSTTPCGVEGACGAMPAIGVICKDGSSGGLVCVQQGARCAWERSCD